MEPQPNYPVSMSDHDLLIRLDQKMNGISTDMKELKDGLYARVSTLEQKIIIYDKLIAEYPISDLTKMLMEDHKWISDFKLTSKLFSFLLVGIGSLLTIITTIVLNVTNILKFK